jgi:mannobiose 2-epimerase
MDAHFARFRSRWYPAAVDYEHGGFGPHLTHDFRPKRENTKFLVYQARLVWVAAEIARRYPDQRGQYLAYAEHGLAFLETRLWDPTHGGLYWEVDEQGVPTTDEKHVYGMAFAIYAAATLAHASGDQRAKDFALRVFRWLDEKAHDGEHLGYFEALSREGSPLLAAPAGKAHSADDLPKDQIGTEYGRKSMNTHLHLLEALTSLYRVTSDPDVRHRLVEVFGLMRERVTTEKAYFHLYFRPDWSPLPGEDSYGHDVEGAYLMMEAAEVLGQGEDAEVRRVARALVDHALAHGWDTTYGGFYDAGPPGGEAVRLDKIWWVQAEGLNGLLLMHVLYGQSTAEYYTGFERQWSFIKDHVIDPACDGWISLLSREGELKEAWDSGTWKAAYHDGRALMQSVATLRAPIHER